MSAFETKNKVWVISILCFAIVTSVWLSQRQTVDTSAVYEKANTLLAVEPLIDLPETTNDDWKKILVNMKPEKTVNLTAVSNEDFDETTVTAQLSKDFFSQYLLLKKGGKQLTSEDTGKIASNVINSGKYTDISGAVYVAKNLHVTNQTSRENLKKYMNEVNLSLKTRSSQIKENPIVIINKVAQSQDEKDLAGLDKLISIAQGFINDFLNMTVPENAVTVHLALLNSFSNLLSDLQGMRMILVDPVRSLSAIGQYNKHNLDFYTALKNMNSYFSINGLQ